MANDVGVALVSNLGLRRVEVNKRVQKRFKDQIFRGLVSFLSLRGLTIRQIIYLESVEIMEVK